MGYGMHASSASSPRVLIAQEHLETVMVCFRQVAVGPVMTERQSAN